MMIRSLILTTALASFISFGAPQTAQSESVMCTMDAKLCPDGSAVGRTGPDCEFAACPGEEADDGTDHMDDGDDSATLPDDADVDDADVDEADDSATDDMEHDVE